ncbi:MAG: peptidylprolyl isomerase, partial [Bacteroidota bacterium]
MRHFTDPATQQVIPALQGPDGQLDPQKLLAAIQNLYESEQDDQWIPIERAIKNDKYVNKYYDLLRKGYFVTDVEAKDGFGANSASVGFRYVVKGFETIADSTIAVSDAEAKDYYNAHVSDQAFYQKEDERALQYVLFEVVASAEDIEEARQEMEELRPEFEVAENDTFFVLDNAENRTNPIRYYKQGSVPPEMDSLVANADTGALFGPYQHEGAYHLTKVIGIKTTPDSIQARHILVQVAANDSAGAEAARNQLDSLRQVIAENDNFGDIARQFSQDNSAQNGGELPVFGPGQMVLPFEDACLDTDPGEMVIVQSRFGVHLIEVMDKSAPKRQVALAVVDRVIRPSKTTYDVTYDEASKFAYASQDAESFNANATASQYIIRPEDRIRKETPELRGVTRSRSVIQWALQQEEVGKVSDPFDLDNQYVVVLLTDIKSAGVRPFEEVVDVAKSEVIKTKKAEKITAEMSGQTSVDALAAELGLRVETVDDLTFGAYSIPGIRALEMDLMGNIFSLTQGDLSLPLAGNQGVYVVAL